MKAKSIAAGMAAATITVCAAYLATGFETALSVSITAALAFMAYLISVEMMMRVINRKRYIQIRKHKDPQIYTLDPEYYYSLKEEA